MEKSAGNVRKEKRGSQEEELKREEERRIGGGELCRRALQDFVSKA